jgi:putative membrane protein
MFLDVLLFLALGIVFGIITGMIPGLHPNTIFVFILSLMPLLSGFPPECVISFVVSLSVTNTFIDFIPSMFFGAPEPSNVLSVLPAHRFLLSGNGYEALFLTVVGGFTVSVITFLTFPLLLVSIPFLYTNISPYIHLILVAIVLWMIYDEKGISRLASAFVFLAAGLFGFLSLNTLPSEMVMFPALTGLFGFSQLVITIYNNTKIPEQDTTVTPRTRLLRGGLTGWLAGMFAGLLPGVGTSQAGIIASRILRAKTRDFMIALGGINTSNIIFTFLVFYTIGKTRSGSAWLMSQILDNITPNMLLLMLVTGLTACFISTILTMKTGRLLLPRLNRVNYRKMNIAMIAFLVVSIILFTGLIGLYISLLGAFIGIFAIISGIKRSHMMGFLILPTIIYFSGISGHVMFLMGI